jgi:hypothetical protein
MKRADLWIAGLVVGLSAWAVWAQVDTDPVGEALSRQGSLKLDIGQPLEDQDVRNVQGATFRLHATFGAKATVFYAWSVTCPCVDFVDDRLLPVIERFKPQGVKFVAVAGDGNDTAAGIAARLSAAWSTPRAGRLRTADGLPPYGLIHDPTQRLCKQLGFREAAQFVVVDANGVLCYRGTFDNDLKKPTATWLPDAIEDVVEGRHVASPLRPVPGYGCPFGIPPADCPVDAPGS